MKRGMVALLGLLALTAAARNTQAKTLEEVLKEKGVITEADYAEILTSAPKSKPVDYKPGKGFTFTSPDEKFQLSLGGNLQLLYSFNQNETPYASTVPLTYSANSSQFRLRRIKTNFSGYAFTKDLTYKVLLNWAELNSKVSGSSSTDTSKVLEEAYLNYRFVDEAQIEVGEDKVQYGRQEITSSGAQQFVDRSFVVNAFKPSYDIGLNLHGDVMKGLFRYDAQWIGGKGQNTTSGNVNNAYNLRLVVNPLGDMKYSEADIEMSAKPLLGLGASYYHNTLKKTAAGTFESNNNSYAGSSGWLGKNASRFSATANVNINTFETDLAVKWQGLSFQSEYFWAEGTGTGSTSRDAVVTSNGMYAQAGYMVLPKQVEVALRYSWMDYNNAVSNDNQSELQGAVSWYIAGHNLKVQADYTRQNVQRNVVIAGLNINSPLKNDMFRVQTQLNF